MAVENFREEKRPVAKFGFAAQTFPATLTAALAPTIPNVNGTIVAMDIVTTDTEDGITYTVTITNGNGAAIFSEASLTDNASHWRVARSNKGTPDANFNEAPVAGTLTATITPSNKPDAAAVGAKTATVTVTLYVE